MPPTIARIIILNALLNMASSLLIGDAGGDSWARSGKHVNAMPKQVIGIASESCLITVTQSRLWLVA